MATPRATPNNSHKNDLHNWLIVMHRGRVRLEGLAAHEFALLYEAKLRGFGADTAFYEVPWTRKPTVFAGVSDDVRRPACHLLAWALATGAADVVLRCISPHEAVITQGSPRPEDPGAIVDLSYQNSDRIPRPTEPPPPEQFQEIIGAIAGGKPTCP